MRFSFFAVALLLAAAAVSAQNDCTCTTDDDCSAQFPPRLSENNIGTTYDCRGSPRGCLGSNDGSGLGAFADAAFNFNTHSSCWPLDTPGLQNTLVGNPLEEFFFFGGSTSVYNVRGTAACGAAAEPTSAPDRVFACENCFVDCGTDSGNTHRHWMPSGMTFNVQRAVVSDGAGGIAGFVPVGAVMAGTMVSATNSAYEANVVCTYTDYNPNDGTSTTPNFETSFHCQGGDTSKWSEFATYECEITWPTALGGQTVTFGPASRSDAHFQIGTDFANLGDVLHGSAQDLGASGWVEMTAVEPARNAGQCRFTNSENSNPTYGNGFKEQLDWNIILDPICTWSCDPTGTIDGDPHLTGFLGQKMNLLGEDGHVYNMISSPHLQYNVRLNQTRYMVGQKHASLIGEMGLRVGDSQVRIYFASPEAEEIVVEVNGVRIMPGDNEPVMLNGDGSEWIMRTPRARSVLIVTRDYHFNVEGKLHQFRHLDDGVQLVNWMGARTHHGMLGQTANPEKADKGTKETVVDYEWPFFLDGSLNDYDVAGADVFGTDYTYSQFDASA